MIKLVLINFWAGSSSGRTPHLQCGGERFDSAPVQKFIGTIWLVRRSPDFNRDEGGRSRASRHKIKFERGRDPAKGGDKSPRVHLNISGQCGSLPRTNSGNQIRFVIY